MTISRKTKSDTKLKPDKFILLFAIFMSIFGAIMIYDASVFKASSIFNDQFYFLKFQLLWIAIGIVPTILIYYWDYRKILKLSLPLLIGIIVLLVLVLFLGEQINGSRRWFAIGPLPTIQPAEFAKLFIIIYL